MIREGSFFEANNAHKIIIKEKIDQDTLKELDLFCKQHDSNKKFELVIENNYTLPRIMINWLQDILLQKESPCFKLSVTEERLYFYLHSLGFPVDIKHCDKSYCTTRAIVIGGSAGSSAMIEKMLSSLKPSKISIFIIQHTHQGEEGVYKTILKHFSSLEISYPENMEKVQEGKIYVTPPNHHMKIVDGYILLDQEEEFDFSRPSLSILYESFAKEYGANGICITSCGHGQDGSDVIEKLSRYGTHIIVQDPNECDAKMMPLSIKNTQKYTHLLPIDAICELLTWLTTANIQEKKELFFPIIKKLYGYDFTHYHIESLERLQQSEMQRCNCTDKHSFCEHALLNRDTFEKLFYALTVNVTEFFRSPQTFIPLRELIKKEERTLAHMKFWIAGCASGEEAYSLAMILFDLGVVHKSLIYATDVDESMVQISRNGLYAKKTLEKSAQNAKVVLQNITFRENIAETQKYFSINEKLREKTLFFKHNLAVDSTFNEFNFILCKNVLIYFDSELQKKVFQLFYDSLSIGGYLQLGVSETLLYEFRDRFKAIDIENKIYQRIV